MSAIVQLKSNGRRGPSMFRYENCGGVQAITPKNFHRSKCRNTTYCSKDCLETAKATYHQVLCGKDFSWLTSMPQPTVLRLAPGGFTDIDGQLWLRILATYVQSGLHPLELPTIASLTPNYESPDGIPRRWSSASHIDVPQKILTTLGVDTFKDIRYDSWYCIVFGLG